MQFASCYLAPLTLDLHPIPCLSPHLGQAALRGCAALGAAGRSPFILPPLPGHAHLCGGLGHGWVTGNLSLLPAFLLSVPLLSFPPSPGAPHRWHPTVVHICSERHFNISCREVGTSSVLLLTAPVFLPTTAWQ